MGDVKGGSETPKLVSRVLQWKKEKPEESSVVYDQLNSANLQFMKELREMREKYDSDPETYIKELDHSIEPLTVAIKNIRKGLQALTQKSEVPLNLMSKPSCWTVVKRFLVVLAVWFQVLVDTMQ